MCFLFGYLLVRDSTDTSAGLTQSSLNTKPIDQLIIHNSDTTVKPIIGICLYCLN
jgi:hypothetical protein